MTAQSPNTRQTVLTAKQIAEFATLAKASGIKEACDKLAADVIAAQTATEQREKGARRRSQMDYLDNLAKDDGDLASALVFLTTLLNPLISGRRVDVTQRDLIAARTLARQATLELERARLVLAALRGDIVS